MLTGGVEETGTEPGVSVAPHCWVLKKMLLSMNVADNSWAGSLVVSCHARHQCPHFTDGKSEASKGYYGLSCVPTKSLC